MKNITCFLFMLVSLICNAQETTIHQAEVPAPPLTVSPRIGEPLREAKLLLDNNDAKGALDIVSKLTYFENTTKQEQYLIARVQAAAAGKAMDYVAAEAAMRHMLSSGFLAGDEADKFVESLASIYAWRDAHSLATALLSDYLKGKDKPHLEKLLRASRLANQKNINDLKTLREKIARADLNGGTVNSAEVKQLAHLCDATENLTCYDVALERLASLDPNSSFRKDMLTSLGKKYGNSQRIALELFRLELQQYPLSPADYVMFARLLSAAGAPAEAMKLVQRGFNENILGQGKEAALHSRLRDFVNLQLAEAKRKRKLEYDDGLRLKQFDKIATMGFDMVHDGEAEEGLAMINKAISSGQLKDTAIATLHYGVALAMTNQKRHALEVLKTVNGSDGLPELARYWTLQIKLPAIQVPR